MLQVLDIVFPIFALVLVGYLYALRFDPDMASANRLNIEVFTPALIVSVLAGKGFEVAAFTDLALAGGIVVLGSGLLAWPAARLLGYRARVFLPPMMFNNSGNMGLPLALFAFGKAALPAAMILFLVENTLHFTVGNAMLTGHVNPLKLLRMPMLQATLVGLAVSLGGFGLPGMVYEAIHLLGQVAIPSMLFALGVRMTAIEWGDWKIGLAAAVLCPATGVVSALAASQLVSLPDAQLTQLILFGALPPAVLNYLLAERYDLEPHRVAAIVLMGNLGSLVVIPATLLFVL